MPVTVRPVNSHRNEITARKGPTLGQPFYWGAVVLSYERLRQPARSASHPCDSSRDDCCMYLRNDLREIKSLADIPHIKPEVSKEPTILYVDDCTDAPERCQTRYRAYWTTFWCGGWWSIGWESHLRYTMAPFQPLQTRTSPLVTPHHLR